MRARLILRALRTVRILGILRRRAPIFETQVLGDIGEIDIIG
jgi:hypothetical protein